MILVLAIAAAIVLIGRAMDVPWRARWLMLMLLYVAVLFAKVALPESNPLSLALGGSAGEWFVIGALGAAVWAYSRGLRKLRERVRPENRAAPPPKTAPSALERNARHIVLRELGGPGQAKLNDARVLVVGAGGLGSPVLQYLGAAGVGTLGVIDFDAVETSNLGRQVIHTDERVGMPKVFSAQKAVEAQNPHVTVRPYNRRLTEKIAEELFAEYDLVIDGCDDPSTRYLVNAVCVAQRLPLVSGALSQWEGQVSVFDPARDAPCYACVFPEAAAPGLAPSCAEGGVLGPLPGVVGSMMAVEAIKVLSGAGRALRGRMVIYDALWGESREISVTRRASCPVCGGGRATG